jgi:hypothetical protein
MGMGPMPTAAFSVSSIDDFGGVAGAVFVLVRSIILISSAEMGREDVDVHLNECLRAYIETRTPSMMHGVYRANGCMASELRIRTGSNHRARVARTPNENRALIDHQLHVIEILYYVQCLSTRIRPCEYWSLSSLSDAGTVTGESSSQTFVIRVHLLCES